MQGLVYGLTCNEHDIYIARATQTPKPPELPARAWGLSFLHVLVDYDLAWAWKPMRLYNC